MHQCTKKDLLVLYRRQPAHGADDDLALLHPPLGPCGGAGAGRDGVATRSEGSNDDVAADEDAGSDSPFPGVAAVLPVLLYLGLVPTAVGFWLWNKGAARTSAARLAVANNLKVPLAVLELKQGLGRLLRSSADRGLLSVLDPRLTTKRYGRVFLKSLPPYRIVREIERCEQFFHGREG